MDRATDSPRDPEAYLWCAACQKVHAAAAWDVGLRTCPGCGGNARDARPWSEVRQRNAAYPEQPGEGERYDWGD